MNLQSHPCDSGPVRWEALLGQFPLATPALIESRALQIRADSKCAIALPGVVNILRVLGDDYAIQPAGTALVATYRTLYFDTAGLALFHAHRRGCRVRHKVRIRHYPDRNVSFLEVKSRLSDRQTVKVRRPRTYGDDELCAEDVAFVRAHAGFGRSLIAQAWVNYRRITLASLRTNERVTVDFDVTMARGMEVVHLGDLAIVEVKQWPYSRRTAAMLALRAAGGWTGSVSKYCTAIALLEPALPHNQLLPWLRSLGSVVQETRSTT